jgi:hypothetical protein
MPQSVQLNCPLLLYRAYGWLMRAAAFEAFINERKSDMLRFRCAVWYVLLHPKSWYEDERDPWMAAGELEGEDSHSYSHSQLLLSSIPTTLCTTPNTEDHRKAGLTPSKRPHSLHL